MNKLLIFLLSLLAVSLGAATITNWGSQLPTAAPVGSDVILMQKGGVTYYFTPNQLAVSLATNVSLNASNKIANLNGVATNLNLRAVNGSSLALTVDTNLLVVTGGNGGKVGIGTASPDYAVDIEGTNTIAASTIGINGQAMLYLPEQTNFVGSMAVGNGLRNLFHNSGETGQCNTAVGINALYSNVFGLFNTAVGNNAIEYNRHGQYNVGVGQGALRLGVSSIGNAGFGTSALYNNQGNYNTALAVDALQYHVSGTENAAGGFRALWLQTNGNYNTGFGGQANRSMVSSDNNSAFGWGALYSNLTNANTSVGANSAFFTTTGKANAVLGTAAFYNNVAGSFNVVFGSDAGRYQADGSTPLTGAEYSIYIGNDARGLNNSDNNSIVIGALAKGLGVNTVVLGSDQIAATLLKGNVGIGTGTTLAADVLEINDAQKADITLFSDANVSILTTNAMAINYGGTLSLGGLNAAGLKSGFGAIRGAKETSFVGDISGYLALYTTRTNAGTFERLRITSTGNVGIGTAIPSSSLDVTGQVRAASAIITNTISAPTNTANFNLVTNNFALDTYYTNSGARAWVSAVIGMTNVLATEKAWVALYLDQDGDGSWERTGIAVRAQGVIALAVSEQLSSFIQPSGRFIFTNLGTVANAGIEANSSQWVRQ